MNYEIGFLKKYCAYHLKNIVFFGLCGLVFAVFSQTKFAISSAGLFFRYDSVFLPIFLAGFFFLLTKLPQHLALAGVMLLSASLCGVVLAGVRFGHVSDLATLAGLYPHSDGRSYLNGALNLLHGHPLNPFASRRPLAILFWAFLLELSGMNIRTAMALMVFICALAIGCVTRETSRNFGWLAGYVIFLGLFFFYRRFIATFLTEHLGLALGCFGIILLLRSFYEERKSVALGGLLLLTLALNARAGAFFILPALALWAGWNWRKQYRFSFKTCGIAFAVIGLGFVLNALTIRTIGQAEAGQGNFSYTLYGLVHDGDWTLAKQQHPELSALPEIERHQKIYDLAWAKIASQPSSLLRGAARAYFSFFCTQQGPYSFVFFALQQSILKSPSPNAGKNSSAATGAPLKNLYKYLNIIAIFSIYGILFLLAIAGFFFLLQHISPVKWLLFSGWLGILASVPFIPPWDADLMRVHAATIPFLLFPPALGLSCLFARIRKEQPAFFAASQRSNPRSSGLELTLPAGITFLFCLLPFLFVLRKTVPAQSLDSSCPNGEPLLVRLVPGSIITISANDALQSDKETPAISALRKNNGILFANDSNRANAFLQFIPGQILCLGYERISGAMRYLVLQDNAGKFNSEWTSICAAPLHRDGMTTWWMAEKL